MSILFHDGIQCVPLTEHRELEAKLEEVTIKSNDYRESMEYWEKEYRAVKDKLSASNETSRAATEACKDLHGKVAELEDKLEQYDANSLDYWMRKARAYGECAGVIASIKIALKLPMDTETSVVKELVLGMLTQEGE